MNNKNVSCINPMSIIELVYANKILRMYQKSIDRLRFEKACQKYIENNFLKIDFNKTYKEGIDNIIKANNAK